MSSLNCLNIVIIIHLKSLSKISSMSFLLGVIVIGSAAFQGDILSWFLILFYFCAEICESEICFVFRLNFLSFCSSPLSSFNEGANSIQEGTKTWWG